MLVPICSCVLIDLILSQKEEKQQQVPKGDKVVFDQKCCPRLIQWIFLHNTGSNASLYTSSVSAFSVQGISSSTSTQCKFILNDTYFFN